MKVNMPSMGRVLTVAVMLGWACVAGGEETPSDAERNPRFDHHPEPLTAKLSVNYFGYPHDSEKEDRNHFLEGEILLTFGGRLGDALQYSISPQFRFDSADRTEAKMEFQERSLTRPALTAQEAYGAWYGDVYEIAVGKKIFSWGVGDGSRPTDNVNPLDSLDVPSAEKIGVPALSIFRYGEGVNSQFVFVPVFTPSRVPADDNRWAVQDTTGIERVYQAFGQWPTVIDAGRDLPETTLDNAQYALNLSSSTLITGWDLALTYYRGHYSFGVLESQIIPPQVGAGGMTPPTLIVQKVYPKYQEFGTSISTTVGDWELHAEGAFHLTDEGEMDDDFWEYVTGFNYTSSGILTQLLEEIQVTVEYAGISVTRRRPPDSLYSDVGFGRGLTNSLLSKVDFKFSEDTRFEVAGAVNFDDGDFSIQTVLTHKAWDRITFEAGYQWFEGPEDSFFGGWDENDRVFLSVTGNFEMGIN